jgi:hypothetical protein
MIEVSDFGAGSSIFSEEFGGLTLAGAPDIARSFAKAELAPIGIRASIIENITTNTNTRHKFFLIKIFIHFSIPVIPTMRNHLTVIFFLTVLPPALTVIVTLPFFFAVRRPALSMLTTLALFDLKLTLMFVAEMGVSFNGMSTRFSPFNKKFSWL